MKKEEIACIEAYLSFFTKDRVMKFLQTFIMKLLALNYNIDEMLKNKKENLCLSNEAYYGTLVSELENPIHNIALKVIQNFMEKFPKECIYLVNYLIQKLLQSKYLFKK